MNRRLSNNMLPLWTPSAAKAACLRVTLYDLTNTDFAGKAAGNPKARRGHSNEKRRHCPLLTLGLALDGSGAVPRCR